MSTETQTSTLDAMMAQYQKNTAPKTQKSADAFKYDEKLYFSHMLKDGETSATKTIRILPVANGSPFVEVWTHKGEVDGKSKTFACLQKLKGEACPFCEAKEALYATGDKDDAKLAGKYAPRLTYVVKVIDRDNEDHGVKFWRFNHDGRKEGIYDKIFGVINAIKKDIAHPETGRDLVLTVGRNQNNVPIVTSVAQLDPSPLHTDEATKQSWLSHDKTWQFVYPVKNYEYMEIVVKGGTPVWDREKNCFVKKSEGKPVDASESETTMGIENVKQNIIQSTATSTPADATEDESDDLPF
jgi:hypothetical protein